MTFIRTVENTLRLNVAVSLCFDHASIRWKKVGTTVRKLVNRTGVGAFDTGMLLKKIRNYLKPKLIW